MRTLGLPLATQHVLRRRSDAVSKELKKQISDMTMLKADDSGGWPWFRLKGNVSKSFIALSGQTLRHRYFFWIVQIKFAI